MDTPGPCELTSAIRHEVDEAAERILSAAEQGLKALGACGKDRGACAQFEALFQAILEACAFHDLVGQRLSNLEGLLEGGTPPARRDSLLNGPAPPGQGLDQGLVDKILET